MFAVSEKGWTDQELSLEYLALPRILMRAQKLAYIEENIKSDFEVTGI